MAAGEADGIEQDRSLSHVSASQASRQLDLLIGVEVGDEVVGRILEDDAEPAPAQPASLPGRQPGDVAFRRSRHRRRGPLEPGEDAQ